MLKLIKKNVEVLNGYTKSLYKCSCGKRKVINDNNVKYGKTKSCGCLQKERASLSTKTHGMTKTRVHGIWVGMIGRCNVKSNSSYENYGAKGIKVCERWLNFENFLEDMGQPKKNETIDRIDNKKGYEPNNCRWATYQEQSFNQNQYRKNSSGFRGVNYSKSRGQYVARIVFNKKNYHLGCSKDLKEAIKLRLAAEIKFGVRKDCDIEKESASILKKINLKMK